MRFWLMTIYLLCCHSSWAVEPLYPLQDAAQTARFQTWIKQVRCIVCQGQNVSESSVPLAMDLKQKIYELIRNQKSDDEIKQYLVARYGERILFLPPVMLQTYLLWIVPMVAMALCVYRIARRS